MKLPCGEREEAAEAFTISGRVAPNGFYLFMCWEFLWVHIIYVFVRSLEALKVALPIFKSAFYVYGQTQA
jgi:hypothetical protein